ncbi:MAG: hypothetical protein OQK09_15550 [Colwellia sp.]|nr:hypothetical protein [Colwellia sp.]MCW8865111.1 hypothetical protein [Colwellia sp.]MCW9082923.1 hypothetical protein [Colwellia sp.]
MQLSKHLAQGKLLYLSQGDEAISVSENEHFRWLAFTNEDSEQVIQSVMHKRKPWQLTLPHQTALLLPLLFFRPHHVTELGLGGGNLDRFLTHLSPDIAMNSIENNKTVITCFERYFNPNNADIKVENLNSKQWLEQPNKTKPDWLICDIYQTQHQSAADTNQQLTALIDSIDSHSCLSINLPDASDEEVNLCLTVLQQIQNNHHIHYFHIPNYLNIIIQLIPKHWQTTRLLRRNKNSYLPKHLFLHWRKFWRYGNEVSANTHFK